MVVTRLTTISYEMPGYGYTYPLTIRSRPYTYMHLQPKASTPTASWTTGNASILPQTRSYSFLSMQAQGSVSDNRFVFTSLFSERPEHVSGIFYVRDTDPSYSDPF